MMSKFQSLKSKFIGENKGSIAVTFAILAPWVLVLVL